MRHKFLWAAALLAASAPLFGQSPDDLNLQFHGYAAQGFLYTTHNNIFYSDSSDGSAAWSEAVINMTAQPKPALRVGVQARYQLLGRTVNAITLDWAEADYKMSDEFGVRFGKVKTPWGLFNETQDIDPSYMWALLPQSVYDITTRDSDLAHYGGVAYGSVAAGSKAGKMDYRLWGGEEVIPKSDGQFDDLNNSGNGPLEPLEYLTLGGALHWRTPVNGLMAGASDAYNGTATVLLSGGSESFSDWNNLSYFAQYVGSKVMLAGEWNRQASPAKLMLTGRPAASASSDAVGWYAMGTYKLRDKLSAGAYYSAFIDHDAPLGPDRFTKDWTVSARYDLNEFIYIKAEQHFIHGTALSLDSLRNPAPTPQYDLTALRIGVSF
jgi:hypothetical protein